MTKSTITRERLEQLADNNTICKVSWDERIELAQIALAAMDSEPVAYISKSDFDAGYPHILARRDFNKACTMPVYAAQPAPVVPVVPDEIKHRIGGLDWGWEGEFNRCWNACRAAMLQELKKSAGAGAVCRSSDNAQVLTSINPAPTLVSLPKNAKSLTGNSPVIGIDLASGPDRTVEVHYVVPPGYVVVPKEPTDEMIAAAMNCEDVLFNSDDSFCIQFVNIYEAMLAAAPKEVK
ncbi:hypothetical protein [Klebsiella quasipneumoniae]|uniref:hypothetical protein n=1 Tax=Klebsiella quasipneumoniae TaxID=1463165 RepID=UPI000E2A410E|nr:hypothetical protein [Klebsiella quasipneumoniae]SXD02565.1 Uncharacterised protein [Klebsiella quasipneumoniae]